MRVLVPLEVGEDGVEARILQRDRRVDDRHRTVGRRWRPADAARLARPRDGAPVERAEQEEADELLGHQELDVEARGPLRLIDLRRHSTTPDERSQTPIGAWTAR